MTDRPIQQQDVATFRLVGCGPGKGSSVEMHGLTFEEAYAVTLLYRDMMMKRDETPANIDVSHPDGGRDHEVG